VGGEHREREGKIGGRGDEIGIAGAMDEIYILLRLTARTEGL
jgi:hypothetical protein